jgi:WD40 repeat protein
MRVLTSLTTVDISRALAAIPGEFGALLGQQILEKRIDGDELLEWLNSVEEKAEEPIVTDVFCKHSHLFLPFLDRVSWNHLCSAKSQIYDCSRFLTPPWPQKHLRVGSPVISVAFSPDNECLACGSADGMVRLWNNRDGSCTLLEGHTEDVECVSFSPNGKILASGSGDESIRLWKLEDQQSHTLLEGHDGPISSIAFSPSGSSLASGCCGGSVRLWDINDGRCARIFIARAPCVWSVAFSPDGATLATLPTLAADKAGGTSVFLWDLESEGNSSSPPSSIIETNGRDASCLVYSPNGVFLASVVDSSIKIWRASDGSLKNDLKGSQHASVSFSSNGKLVASGGHDGTVRLWTMNDLDPNCLAVCPSVHRSEEDEDEDEDDIIAQVNSVAFTPNGQTLASGGDDGTIFLWDTRKFL